MAKETEPQSTAKGTDVPAVDPAAAARQETADTQAAQAALQERGTPGPGRLETASGAGGGDQVQAATDAAEDQGYFGHSPDPTPRDHYSVGGVLAGKPTPETDAEAAAAAETAARDLERLGTPEAGGPKA